MTDEIEPEEPSRRKDEATEADRAAPNQPGPGDSEGATPPTPGETEEEDLED